MTGNIEKVGSPCAKVIRLRQVTPRRVTFIDRVSVAPSMKNFEDINSPWDLIKTLACNLILISGLVSIGQKQVSFPSSTPINRNKRIFRDVETFILTLSGDFLDYDNKGEFSFVFLKKKADLKP